MKKYLMKKQIDLSFYLVLDSQCCEPLGMIETARLAVASGVTTVQLRYKQAGTQQRVEMGYALQQVLANSTATLIINDDYEAAMRLKADGLHIGQGDVDVIKARQIIGEDMLLGLSVGSLEQARAVDPRLVDYIGVGAVFATTTKRDHPPTLGFTGLAEIVTASAVPVVAIGGLKYQHIKPVFATGADGIAVVSAICGQDDVSATAQSFCTKITDVTHC
jgi:thiamine-phosphate pyrophosphorylase